MGSLMMQMAEKNVETVEGETIHNYDSVCVPLVTYT